MGGPHEHGDPITAWRVFRSSDLPFHRRLVAVARNLGRRIVTRSDCCGHPGEPGC